MLFGIIEDFAIGLFMLLGFILAIGLFMVLGIMDDIAAGLDIVWANAGIVVTSASAARNGMRITFISSSYLISKCDLWLRCIYQGGSSYGKNCGVIGAGIA
jgi:hypothetical protein